MSKPILCLDFDGVIHSYTSGWQGAAVIPDPPVPGWLCFLCDASRHFRIAIFSSRSSQPGGIDAMKAWLGGWVLAEAGIDADQFESAKSWLLDIEWPIEKPPAFLTISLIRLVGWRSSSRAG